MSNSIVLHVFFKWTILSLIILEVLSSEITKSMERFSKNLKEESQFKESKWTRITFKVFLDLFFSWLFESVPEKLFNGQFLRMN